MKLHHLRNAALVIEAGSYHILVDPMLEARGTLPAFARFRHRPFRNPTVDLPAGANAVLEKVTHWLITHLEALNHCPTRRSALRRALTGNGLGDRVFVPDDGETLDFD